MAEPIQAATGTDLSANTAAEFTFDPGVSRVVIQPNPAASTKIWAKFDSATVAMSGVNGYHLCADVGQALEWAFRSPLESLALMSDGAMTYGKDFVVWGT